MIPELVVLYAALILFAIYRQFATQKALSLGLLVIPALVAFAAVQAFGAQGFPSTSAANLALIGVNGALGVATGVWRGYTFKIWSASDGTLWRKGTWWTLANWLLLVALRISVAFFAVHEGMRQAEMTGDLLVSLFLTFAAQNLVVWFRSQSIAGAAAAIAAR
jgi:hypothetical protein